MIGRFRETADRRAIFGHPTLVAPPAGRARPTWLAEFRKQWMKYVETTERLGKRLDDALGEYHELVSTRTRQLDRQMEKIDELILQRYFLGQ